MAKAWWRDSDYELFDRLTRERDEARAEVERLEVACHAWAEDMREAARLCEQAGNEMPIDAVRRFVSSKAAIVDMLQDRLSESRAEVGRLMHQLADATNESTHFQVMCKREREEVERLTRERDSARDRILEYTDALVERDAEIASLTAALDERDVEAERVREQYDALATERDEARAIANAAVRELNDASAQAFIREQDVRALRDAAYERGAEAMRRACIQETGIVAALEELWIGPEDE